MSRGMVYLIGAGPGDPELLTLKAARALARCDVVLVDDLVHRDALRHCRPTVRVIDIGKRGGCASTPQAFIERLMVRLAARGEVVGRVKGGDPYVFGRGAEEVAALEAAGVAVEIVSGVTAGIGVPAALGIPVTHRDLARGVALVTGHPRAGGREPDWAALARSGMTLVVYMGVRRLAEVAAALLAAGLPAETPAAAIQNGTLPEQASVVSTIAFLARDVAARGIASPAVVVVGAVVALARRDRSPGTPPLGLAAPGRA
jgi:uroporphyrin-III C-methyltransferase